jgi:hypothetical protein
MGQSNRVHLRFARACSHIRAMDLKLWTTRLQEAEAELDAATAGAATSTRPRGLMQVKAELKRRKQKP